MIFVKEIIKITPVVIAAHTQELEHTQVIIPVVIPVVILPVHMLVHMSGTARYTMVVAMVASKTQEHIPAIIPDTLQVVILAHTQEVERILLTTLVHIRAHTQAQQFKQQPKWLHK